MRHIHWISALAIALLTTAMAVAQTDAAALKTQKDKFSYALGMDFGSNFRKQGLDLDPAIFAKAFADAFSAAKTAMTEQDMKTLLAAAAQDIRKKQADDAQQQGDKFMAENKAKEGVVSLASGLQYKIVKQGTGDKPKLDDQVVCIYKGTLIDGTEFDSSEKHGGPATLPIKGMIPGWTEALQLMPVGSKWQLFIPSKLAYGANGPLEIGPNATLIFDVELVSLKKPAPPVTVGRNASN